MSNTPDTSTADQAPDDVRQAEVEDAPATVTWRGHTFVIPREYADWSVDLLESLEEGKEAGIVRGALGIEQWRVFKATNPTVRDLNELAAELARALGFAVVGESKASSD